MKGAERTKFVNTIRDSTFNPEKTDAETVAISEKVTTRVRELMTQQYDKKHLEMQ